VILLDTHAWIWLAAEPERLSRRASSAIRRAARSGEIAIASISLWETTMIISQGRLTIAGTLEGAVRELVDSTRVAVREITPAIAALSTQFPEDFPKDPADRLIAATARAEGLPLVTKDERIRSSPLLRTIW
jgi:PIN domain nuclease of toxin-antitoxin system